MLINAIDCLFFFSLLKINKPSKPCFLENAGEMSLIGLWKAGSQNEGIGFWEDLRSFSYAGVDDVLEEIVSDGFEVHCGGEGFREGFFGDWNAFEVVRGGGFVAREGGFDQVENLRDILAEEIETGIGASIEGVGHLSPSGSCIEAMNEVNDRMGNVVKVDTGRVRIQADCMELIAVLHGDVGEGLKVTLLNGFCDSLDPFWNAFVGAIRNERGSFYRSLHASRRAGFLSIVTDHENEDLEIWPVGTGSQLDSDGI